MLIFFEKLSQAKLVKFLKKISQVSMWKQDLLKRLTSSTLFNIANHG